MGLPRFRGSCSLCVDSLELSRDDALEVLGRGVMATPRDPRKVSKSRFRGRSADLGGLRDQSGGWVIVVAPFVLDGRAIAKARVQAERVVKGFDIGEAGHARLGLRREGPPAQQFAFQVEKKLSAMALS